MSVISIEVQRGKEYEFISIGNPVIVSERFVKLLLKVGNSYYSIDKELKSVEWSIDIKSRDRIGDIYFANISAAINKVVGFPYPGRGF